MNNKPTYDPIKTKSALIRQVQIEQGAYDGRFNTKTVKDKTKYTRKKKHK